LNGVYPSIFFRRDLNFPIDQTDFNCLNARLASEVLLHPVCSKVSRHTFHAHFHVLNLRLGGRYQAKANEEQ
jgi:hypothetical protein